MKKSYEKAARQGWHHKKALPGYWCTETEHRKVFRSPGYNFTFCKATGYFVRWGATEQDDPAFSPFGPEILDIEVTTSCSGPRGAPCRFCYKGNGPRGQNMSVETFKAILDKMPDTLTQVAFGADATLESNPDIWAMFEYCRAKGIVPNITVANITDETAQRLSRVAGAVAVSRYEDKNTCYDTVHHLTTAGMKQTNIHVILSVETLPMVLETIRNVKTDPRLAALNAVVFLSAKPAGRGILTRLAQDQFNQVMDAAFQAGISFGLDSCSANKFANYADSHNKDFSTVLEPCESFLFSLYVNVEGRAFACSFSEDANPGIDLLNPALTRNTFRHDVWHSAYAEDFRKALHTNAGMRSCPLFNV